MTGDWSRMGVGIRPDIHARFAAICARAIADLGTAPTPEALPSSPPPANATLTPKRVVRMRALRAEGATLEVLAHRFHVAISTVARATQGITWRRVA